MSDQNKQFTIATAIPYLNARPHLGQALEYVFSDVMARYHRSLGQDVLQIYGADEHGQKIARTAAGRGITPQEHVDEMSAAFVALHDALKISDAHGPYVRTSSSEHKALAQAFWKRVQQQSPEAIYSAEYEGMYCVGCEEYKQEGDLVDGKCPLHLVAPEIVKEKNFFFALKNYEAEIRDYLESGAEIPQPKANEMLALVERGLDNVSISRSREKLTWGVAVPDDDEQVMYVWFDALTNYMTGAGVTPAMIEAGDLTGSRWPVDSIVIGKDINRFHATMFIGMLTAAGLPLPKQLAVHGFITVDGQKMSKTLGNIIDPNDLVTTFGAEVTRYLLMAEVPFNTDGDISIGKFYERYAADLSNGIGNLLSRSTNVIEKSLGGKIEEHISKDEKLKESYAHAMDSFNFQEAIHVIQYIVSRADQLLAKAEPWKVLKVEGHPQTEESIQSLSWAIHDLKTVAEMLVPFMPEAAEKIRTAVTAPKITKAAPLFPRLEQ